MNLQPEDTNEVHLYTRKGHGKNAHTHRHTTHTHTHIMQLHTHQWLKENSRYAHGYNKLASRASGMHGTRGRTPVRAALS